MAGVKRSVFLGYSERATKAISKGLLDLSVLYFLHLAMYELLTETVSVPGGASCAFAAEALSIGPAKTDRARVVRPIRAGISRIKKKEICGE